MTFGPAFWKWFGDSHVVDVDNEPLVVYHGSVQEKLSSFDPKIKPVRTRTGPDGIYFTGDPASAGNYTRRPGAGSKERRGRVIAVYLSLQNPLNITRDIRKHIKAGMTFGVAKRLALAKLQSEHDGVIFDGDAYNPDEYIVFNPTQIKAIDNDGTWDADDADIRSNPRRRS